MGFLLTYWGQILHKCRIIKQPTMIAGIETPNSFSISVMA